MPAKHQIIRADLHMQRLFSVTTSLRKQDIGQTPTAWKLMYDLSSIQSKVTQQKYSTQGSLIHRNVQSIIITCDLESSACACEPLTIGSSEPELKPELSGKEPVQNDARHRWRLNTGNYLASPSRGDANPVLFSVCLLSPMPSLISSEKLVKYSAAGARALEIS